MRAAAGRRHGAPAGKRISAATLTLCAAGAAMVLWLAAFPLTASALQKIPPSKFKSAETCGCHAAFFQTWSESMHAQALTDPLYRAKLDEANKATKGALGPFCETCHGPVAAMGGLLGKKPSQRPAQANEGIGCDFCHQVTGTTRPAANSSWIAKSDGVKRGQLKDSRSPYHKSRYSAFHETAEFCGMCHNVNHPGNGLALEATYTEWKNGPYAKKGIVCQDCHMTPGPGVKKPNEGRAAPFGYERPHVYTMTFVGGNTALGPKAAAEERLRAAAELRLDVGQIVAPGTPLKVVASVTNVGAGHYLPTGVTELRRVWLEVVAEDSAGREILRQERVFGTELADAAGNSPVELWEATAIAHDDRIAPGATVSEQYEMKMPSGGPVKVRAALYYRGTPEALARKVGVEMPVTEMAEAQAVVYPSEAALADVTQPMLRPELNAWILPLITLLVIGAMVAVLGLTAYLNKRGEG